MGTNVCDKLLIAESNFFDDQIEQQNEIADHILGMVARRDGKKFDTSKSDAWQRGWAGASLTSLNSRLLEARLRE